MEETNPFLCRACWELLARCTAGDYCPTCGYEVSSFALLDGKCPRCQGCTPAWDGLARSGVYASILQAMILAFKKDHTELGRLFAFLMCQTLTAAPFADRVEIWIPVPLHWRRRLMRGYNQSLLLARSLAGPGVSVRKILKRIRYTKPQPAVTTPAARARNVAGAFAVARPELIEGKIVGLVDDVKTTGATLNECARILKAAGARRVYAVVLAVAGQGTNRLE